MIISSERNLLDRFSDYVRSVSEAICANSLVQPQYLLLSKSKRDEGCWRRHGDLCLEPRGRYINVSQM